MDGDREERGGEVLVDDGLDAAHLTVVVGNDWRSPASTADHERSGLQELRDRILFDDPLRTG